MKEGIKKNHSKLDKILDGVEKLWGIIHIRNYFLDAHRVCGCTIANFSNDGAECHL